MTLHDFYEQIQEFGKQLPSYSADVERYNMGNNIVAEVKLSRTRIKDRAKNRVISSIHFSQQ